MVLLPVVVFGVGLLSASTGVESSIDARHLASEPIGPWTLGIGMLAAAAVGPPALLSVLSGAGIVVGWSRGAWRSCSWRRRWSRGGARCCCSAARSPTCSARSRPGGSSRSPRPRRRCPRCSPGCWCRSSPATPRAGTRNAGRCWRTGRGGRHRASWASPSPRRTMPAPQRCTWPWGSAGCRCWCGPASSAPSGWRSAPRAPVVGAAAAVGSGPGSRRGGRHDSCRPRRPVRSRRAPYAPSSAHRARPSTP